MKQNKDLQAQEILDIARTVINILDNGTEFRLKDLFLGVQWDDFLLRERIKAGTIFRKEVDKNNYSNSVIYTNKNSSNSAVYKKIDPRLNSLS